MNWKGMKESGCSLVLSSLPEWTEENHEKLSHDSQSPGLDLNSGLPKYEAVVLSTGPGSMLRKRR
jgi:hypothetical protein